MRNHRKRKPKTKKRYYPESRHNPITHRDCINSDGTKFKDAYPSRRKARSKGSVFNQTPYKCSDCKKWHLTSYERTNNKQEKKRLEDNIKSEEILGIIAQMIKHDDLNKYLIFVGRISNTKSVWAVNILGYIGYVIYHKKEVTFTDKKTGDFFVAYNEVSQI